MPLSMLATFEILRAAMSSEIRIKDGSPTVETALSLVLAFDLETMIVLESGRPLSGVEVHFSLQKPDRLEEAGLSPTDIGYLFQSVEENGAPWVHGAAMWPVDFDPSYLVSSPHLRRGGSLTISSLETIPEYAPSFVWRPYREHLLKISALTLHASHPENGDREEAD